MSITQTTKNSLINYLEGKGHILVDTNTLVKDQPWTIACAACHKENQIKIHSLTLLPNAGRDICCRHCKFDLKLRKFSEASDLTISNLDPETLHCDLTCNTCDATYHYTNRFVTPLSCYCKLKTKNSERVLFRLLHMWFEEQGPRISKEVRVYQKHKFDLCMELEGKTFYFEVDDIGHYSSRTRQGISDITTVNAFLEDQTRPNTYLIRVSEKSILSPWIMADLCAWIENALTIEPEEKLLLVDRSHKRRYKYLDLEYLEKYYL